MSSIVLQIHESFADALDYSAHEDVGYLLLRLKVQGKEPGYWHVLFLRNMLVFSPQVVLAFWEEEAAQTVQGDAFCSLPITKQHG